MKVPGRATSRFTLLAVIAAVLVAVPGRASAAPPSRVRVGSLPSYPTGAKVVGALPNSTEIPFTVTLKPRDPAALEAYATEVSTPGSSVFHHYLTVAEFRQRFGPTETQIQAVRTSLASQGLTPGAVTANGLAIPVSSTAGRIAHAFSLSFHRVALPSGRRAFANAQAPQVAASVAGLIQGVVGLNTLALVKPLDVPPGRDHVAESPHTGSGPQPCSAATEAASGGGYTINQIASAYQFSDLYSAGDEGSGQTVAVYELEGNFPSDIAAFQSCYGTSASVSYLPVDGGPPTPDPSSGDGLETELDIENVIGIAPEANVLVYQGPNDGGAGPLDTYNAIISQDRANVISTSWGVCEPLEGTSEQESENTLFEEAATQGQSVFAAAGDSGSEDCDDQDSSRALAVDDPASQPFVTGAGGTSMPSTGSPPTTAPTQSAWNDQCGDPDPEPCGGGGGISRLWQMPSYQANAAAQDSALEVINTNSSGSPCGAQTGDYCREVPDVSADADPDTGYVVYWNGTWQVIGGTSGAAPLWAAFTALVNASASCNGVPIGFANPVLYEAAASDYSSDFDDVTSGNNDILGAHGGKFPAGTGYDMATGLGTPNGSALPLALCSAVSVADPAPQTDVIGQPVNVQIRASDAAGLPITQYTASNLPPGLSIDSTTGAISGTPTTVGTYNVTVTASDGTGPTGYTSFSWTIDLRATGTSVSCSPNPIVAGSPTTCTATVSDTSPGTTSTPTGTVNFSAPSGSLSAASCTVFSGSCSVTYTPSASGVHTVGAGYGGDTMHTSSSGSTAVESPFPPTAAITSPLANQTFALNQTVSTMFTCAEGEFGPGIASCQDSNGASGGSGALATATPGTFTYTVTARSGDGLSGSTAITYTVERASSTSVSCSPDNVLVNDATTCTATVSDSSPGTASAPTGAVNFTGSSGSFSAGPCSLSPSGASSSSCQVSYTPSAQGLQTVDASYSGDHTSSSDSTGVEVPVSPTAQISSPDDDQTFTLDEPVTTTFTCGEGEFGSGIASCRDSNGAGGGSGALDTGTTGVHQYTVTATSHDGQTGTATITYTVIVLAPQNSAVGTISGAPMAGAVLTCSPGSWTGDPTSFTYQWSRDGTPIAGATSPTYSVQAIDEGSSLTCAVTATNSAGTGGPTTSPSVGVPVHAVPGCPAATGRLAGTTLGLIKLGETRKQAERAYTHSSNRGTSYEDFFCLTPIGIRVGYASPKLVAALPAARRGKLRQRVIWISTSNPIYAVNGIRPGATLTAAAARLKLGKVFKIGANNWYLAPAGSATAVLKVRGAIVREVGIANKQLTQGRAAQRGFLNSFS